MSTPSAAHLGEPNHQTLTAQDDLNVRVAHEISNPVSFVMANIGHLGFYIDDLFTLIDAYRAELLAHNQNPDTDHLAQRLDLHHLRDDIQHVLDENRQSLERVKQAVQGLKARNLHI
ncbi:hypothetical protein NQT62_09700 [Limnobacter humi]|uniref:Signal transduction histidine kinase dimerisation/phosphoacceptor domain-containing protein n=1 Tax=Limnobacter humi TaxID=1778671 RepID=A0ABT1WGV1_9BURK|nr:hypothetical protein [Limnobacter humi]MCQ8896705.1 hypothetical protein [Limnobacter humi]